MILLHLNSILVQILKWVKVNGTKFQASEHRYDCVKLSNPLTCNNMIFEYARLMWILSGLTSEVLCLAVPLFHASRSAINAQTQGQKAATSCFPPVVRVPKRLTIFPANMLLRIEQVQFVTARDCELGLVNTFYHSNIISSMTHQHAYDSS